MFVLGGKCGYSSPQTLTDQSTAIKRGQQGDLQVLRPHLMCCVPVRIVLFSLRQNKKILNFSLIKTILDRIYKAVNEKLVGSNFIVRQLFSLSYKIKVKRLEIGLDSPHLNQ